MTRKEMAAALEKYIVYYGPIHEDDCPGDDTCDCHYQEVNEGTNAAYEYLRTGRDAEMRALADGLKKALAPELLDLVVLACQVKIAVSEKP